MRTTLTLDPETVLLIQDAVHRQRRSFKDVVNDAIRRGLLAEPVEPYVVQPHAARLLPGVDAGALNRLSEELEDEALLGQSGR